MKSDAAVGNVTINYDNAAGQVVGTYNWGVPVSALKSGAATTTGTKLSDILTDPTSVWSTAVKNVPAGYTVTNSSTVADNATLGGSFSVQVIPANTAQTVSFFSTGSGQALVGTTNPTLSAADKALLSGKTGETIPASTWTSAAFLPGGDLYSIANPNGGTYTFDATTTAQRNTTYTGNITLFYK
ncbi:hypothetical protein [Secundilactobacillus paracollinoides]|uniref:hypothetical protein n=1 Tax=Secundilactobacillus paracollinoides TaxID=240427 RepID=UPI0006F16293|nr:hypothetical protein [Secundilactobacillus paracollinoides]KRL79881.1 hypothetical protein FC17_GL000187 [Secundilactobacillus paracollinoides DSM 15502 = JCM 11969]